MSSTIDVACDLWIIREWKIARDFPLASPDERIAMLMETLEDEAAGYGLPEDYRAGPRLQVFATDDCEVWLGCLSACWIAPEKLLRATSLMIADDMDCAIDAPFVVRLEERRVTHWYKVEASDGAA